MKNILVLALSAVVAGLIYLCATSVMAVTNDDMYPTLPRGSHYVVNRYAYRSGDPHPGEIIVFKNLKMEKPAAKRVIGVPGDSLYMDEGLLIRNGKLLKEPYANTAPAKGIPELTVPEDHFFVLNDRRELSNDSRSNEIGLVKKSDIIGRVIFIF